MDALYDVLGVSDATRQIALDRKLQALRQALSDFQFAGDPDLAPALLAVALMECRMAGCALSGLGQLVARIYGVDLVIRKPTVAERQARLDREREIELANLFVEGGVQ